MATDDRRQQGSSAICCSGEEIYLISGGFRSTEPVLCEARRGGPNANRARDRRNESTGDRVGKIANAHVSRFCQLLSSSVKLDEIAD